MPILHVFEWFSSAFRVLFVLIYLSIRRSNHHFVVFLLFAPTGKYAERYGAGASVYLASVLEYLTAEILELAGNACRDNKKSRIIPRHILLAVKNDEELNRLLSDVTISSGGVIPSINSVLLPKRTGGATKSDAGPSQEY